MRFTINASAPPEEKDGIKYAIQCKRYNEKISAKPIGEALRARGNYKCDKAVKELGYKITDIDQSIIDTVNWMKESGYLDK